MTSVSRELSENLAHVQERIALAAARVSRRSEEITLVAVSKTHSAKKIQQLYEAGVRHFGENRVQERESKLAALAGVKATWHMIGHLQKNKTTPAVQLFDCVDSVDSIALAEKLNRAMDELNLTPEHGAPRRLRVLIEIKLDPEPAKSGIDGESLPRLVQAITQLPHLHLCGLMGVPPYFDDPEQARPYFRRLRELRDAARDQKGEEILPVLSMGMSHDLEVAIEEGANEVRVGTALFGERERG
jgi:pyridoxal phosphate enzyme (YggS family)